MARKKTHRNKDPYAGLNKHKHPKVRQEFIDYDYIDKLSPEEKAMLSKFTDEYYGGSFPKEKKALHKSKKAKRECYKRNNDRNNDTYSVLKVNGLLSLQDNLPNKVDNCNMTTKERIEDAVIAVIDEKSKKS